MTALRKSTLHDLQEQIEREHSAAYGCARNAIEHAVACGRLLITAKGQLAHGEWLTWIENNLSFGPRQAQKYAQLARRLPPKYDLESHSTIEAALDALRTVKEPPRPAPRGTADLTAKRRFEQRRQDEISRLATRMTEVGARYGGRAVAEASNRYEPSIASAYMDTVPLAPSTPSTPPAPSVVVLAPPPPLSTVDRVAALVEQAIMLADADADFPSAIRQELGRLRSAIAELDGACPP